MKLDKETKKFLEKLPDSPGVYIMKASGRVLYVGKAGNLRRRIKSYFLRPHDVRIERLIAEAQNIDFEKTDTAIEALLREAELIKKLMPPYNVREKDDKSFLCVEITKEEFPRVLLVRGKAPQEGRRYGPFTSATSVREVLRILRKIFPWSTHDPKKIGKFARPCFDYEIGLCPGTCTGLADKKEYRRDIKNIRLIFEGKRRKIISSLEKEMRLAATSLRFEEATKIRRQIFALKHIRDAALIKEDELAAEGTQAMRIEGYDISNISGTSAVGSMVVFINGEPQKRDYRKFKIKTVIGQNLARAAGGDTGMLKEILTRRFARFGKESEKSWPLPDLILIDGGVGQVNAAQEVLAEAGLKVPIIGMAKGPKRKKTEIIGSIPRGFDLRTLVRVRDEAHRFAVSYHKNLRSRNSGIG